MSLLSQLYNNIIPRIANEDGMIFEITKSFMYLSFFSVYSLLRVSRMLPLKAIEVANHIHTTPLTAIAAIVNTNAK